jgi:hypothetical protein
MVSPANQTTTNSYADVTGSKIDTLAANHVVYTCLNAHVGNSIDWKVLASIDDVTYVEAQAEATLAAAAVGTFEASAAQIAYRYFKVQVKSTSSGNHGTAQVRGYAKA